MYLKPLARLTVGYMKNLLDSIQMREPWTDHIDIVVNIVEYSVKKERIRYMHRTWSFDAYTEWSGAYGDLCSSSSYVDLSPLPGKSLFESGALISLVYLVPSCWKCKVFVLPPKLIAKSFPLKMFVLLEVFVIFSLISSTDFRDSFIKARRFWISLSSRFDLRSVFSAKSI